MELGEKLKQARLEAGLSQRQLCGEEITRNMLSRIENGVAKPSMKTLQFLAAGLGRPVSYFLEENLTVSPNQERILKARERYDAGDPGAAAALLKGYQGPDPVFDREKELLWKLCHLDLAEQALVQGRTRYAGELLEQARGKTGYCQEALERRWLLIAGQLGAQVERRLPSLDRELILRAREALITGDARRAGRLLDAVQEPGDPHWNLLRGRAHLEAGSPREAARCLHRAEAACPRETAPLLERCYRELEDYKRAYEYACKQK